MMLERLLKMIMQTVQISRICNKKVDSHFEDGCGDIFGDDVETLISELGQTVENISLFDTEFSNNVYLPTMLFGFSKFQVPLCYVGIH